LQRIALLAGLFLVSAPLFAQTPPTPSDPPGAPALSLQAAVEEALTRHPRIEAAARSVEASRAGVRSARAPANPTFYVSPWVDTVNGTTEELLLNQPLEINGTRAARTRRASAEARRADAEARRVRADVVFQVRHAYIEVARQRELREGEQANLRLLEETDRLTARQVELGSRPGIERAQTAIEVARARQRVRLTEGREQAAVAAMNAALGRLPDTPLGALDPLSSFAVGEAMAAPEREAMHAALMSRPEITAATAERDAFRAEAGLHRAEGRPDIAPQFRIQSFTRGISRDDYGASVAVTLPVFDWGGRRERIRQAEAQAQAEEARIRAVENEIRREVAEARARWEAARQILEGFRSDILAQSERLAEASRKGLQTGVVTLLGTLEAQRTLLAVRSEYVQAMADAALARTELERAMGRLAQ
jgi:outer membrane protein, heavy metal efflux system